MHPIGGIDHVAITVRDLAAACAFYDRLFGATVQVNYAPQGDVLVRQIKVGAAMLSVHQCGNGIDLVADTPTSGSLDICFRWLGSIASAQTLLRSNGVDIIAGPAPRTTADGTPSKSVYFRDLDGNLIELMAID